MFIDEIAIHVKAGDGGNGSVSFRREKYVPRGGPDGGDGGNGGSIILEASRRTRTLVHLRYQSLFKAENGSHGQGGKRTGRRGVNLAIQVPVGTIVKDNQTSDILGDVRKEGEILLVARGGRGGRGNARFATSTNRAPRHAEEGSPGEERDLFLELKLLADVGIIGLPNAGKSTLISRISAARPRIADYPFTTLHPNLGMVITENYQSFSIADIPGLIQGAHQGIGLGDRFLRHIERSRLLVHLIDVSRGTEIDPIAAFHIVLDEMRLYNPTLLQKKQLVAASKIDSGEEEKLRRLEHFCLENGYPFLKISAVTGENIPILVRSIMTLLTDLEQEIPSMDKVSSMDRSDQG
jgi:GTP-binding protein